MAKTKNDKKYLSNLLLAWEETYKKGQLTLWFLLAIKDKPKYVSEIQEFIDSNVGDTLACEEQSVYRAMRKFYELEIVDCELHENRSGPPRKSYFLTHIGHELLTEFINRNIKVIYSPKIMSMFTKEG